MHPNDPRLKSFIDVVPDSDFPIQNLPFGIFSTNENAMHRVGVAIGEWVLDLSLLEEMRLLPIPLLGHRVFNSATLNPFISLGRNAWHATRREISQLLRHDNPALRDDTTLRGKVLTPRASVKMHLPITVTGYTDFYSSKEHATNVGAMFRDPQNPLLPNWLHIPIAYNGRASSVVVSGTSVRRPKGQLKLPNEDQPFFGPCRKLDFELEMAFIVGEDSKLGEPVPIDEAENKIFGMVLLNDWSARDIQQWEYVPLGPFNSKSFATSISPWVVMMEALQPFRAESPVQTPPPLPYLHQSGKQAYDIWLNAKLTLANGHMRQLCRTNFRYLYWTMIQQLAHHTVSGCNIRVGDLMGSGTISGTTTDSWGSLLEITRNGQHPFVLENGNERTFLEDGDTVSIGGWCQSDSYRIGFGEVSGIIVPAE